MLLVFVLARVIPGNPCVDALGERATPAQVDACQVRFGLSQPIYAQFVSYLGSVSTGNLGSSIKFHIPVTDLIIQRLPTTIELSFYALLFAIAVGVPLGIVSAYRRNSKTDVGSMMLANLGISTPVFVLGLLLAFLFAIVLKGTPFALPPGGRLSPGVSVKPLDGGVGHLRWRNGAARVDPRLHLRHLHADRADHVPVESRWSTRSST